MSAYYNENDPFAAAWLRELIKENLIAPGEVDERSIEEVNPDDLRGFTQCHFFAGIGIWSYALRNAGWSDDTPVWTGSCPCQGFSASGQRGGFSDKRHLWPAWFRLIGECAPYTIFGEQVSSKDGLAWLDVVSADLENQGYSIGAIDTCAAGVGAPHIRQRIYFVADSERARAERSAGSEGRQKRDPSTSRQDEGRRVLQVGHGGIAIDCANTLSAGRTKRRAIKGNGSFAGRGEFGSCEHAATFGLSQRSGEASLEQEGTPSRKTEQRSSNACDRGNAEINRGGALNGQSSPSHESQKPLRGSSVSFNGSNSDGGDASTEGLQRSGQHGLRAEDRGTSNGFNTEHGGCEGRYSEGQRSETTMPRGEIIREWRGPGWLDPITARSVAEAGATRGYWNDCDWWYGRDGKYRPIGTGLFPLVTGASGRMGKLRGYGNALCAPQAQAFIEAYMSIET